MMPGRPSGQVNSCTQKWHTSRTVHLRLLNLKPLTSEQAPARAPRDSDFYENWQPLTLATVPKAQQKRRQIPGNNCFAVAARGGTGGKSVPRRPVRAANRLMETKDLGGLTRSRHGQPRRSQPAGHWKLAGGSRTLNLCGSVNNIAFGCGESINSKKQYQIVLHTYSQGV